MFGSLVTFVALAGLAIAQNRTIQFFWPHAEDYQVPAVTVQSVNASATVLHVACPSPSDPYNCDWRLGVNYTIFQSSTYEAIVHGYDYALTRTCKDNGKDGVSCYAEGYDERITSAYLANEVWAADTANTVTAMVASGEELLKAAVASAPSSSTSPPQDGSSMTSAGASETASSAPQREATGAAGK